VLAVLVLAVLVLAVCWHTRHTALVRGPAPEVGVAGPSG